MRGWIRLVISCTMNNSKQQCVPTKCHLINLSLTCPRDRHCHEKDTILPDCLETLKNRRQT